jgi:hypothetical protein
MTNPQSNLVELAKQGNTKAIAALINRRLQPKGITTKAALNNGCLQILLEATQTPDQQTLTAFILKGLRGLKIASIQKVKIYARRRGEEKMVWSQEVVVLRDSLSQAKSDLIALPVKTKQIQAEQIAARKVAEKVEQKTVKREVKKSTVPERSFKQCSSNLIISSKQINKTVSKPSLLATPKLFFASKKGVALIVLSVIGILVLSISYILLFPSQDIAFRNELSQLLNSSNDSNINLRVQKSFNDRFGYEKAKEIGMSYCAQRSRGVSDREITQQTNMRSFNLMSQGKVSAEEATTLALVDISIVLAAQRTYCPEFKSN